MHIIDGIYEEVVDDSSQIVRTITAGGGPMYPPADWFESPEFERPTPITVTPEGQIRGHIAPWEADHIGLPPGTKPPHSPSDYSFFKTGVLKLDDGNETFVGQLTLAGGHAGMNASAGESAKHYDDTASAVADITAGEDEHGIWISGAIRPGVTEDNIRALRASAPSGDWRPINGALELVAVCQVNTPGFPVARAMVASGEVTALVAAGARQMYELQQEYGVFESLGNISSRVADLEAIVAGGFAKKNKPVSDDSEENATHDPEAPDQEKADSDEPTADQPKKNPKEIVNKKDDLRKRFAQR